MHCLQVIVLILLAHVLNCQDRNQSNSSCQPSDTICEFFLVVEERLTMMHEKDLVFPENGKLYRYDVTNTSSAEPLPAENVITGDGFERPRLVVVANGTMPGPTIRVFEGQTVILNVRNKLLSDGVTIHIHGLPQIGTPWMDGVAFVTQCPIDPGQYFAYRFQAVPKGTYWWHSHIGSQRTMGLFGAFIVQEREITDEINQIGEHILSLQDWNSQREADFGYQQMKTDIFIGRNRYNITESLDGGKFSKFYMTSGLVNGRGRYYDPVTEQHNGAPLTKCLVLSGQKYRFRVIGASELYPFRFSIDGHMLEVISSDGFEIEPVIVESFIIYPGERYDFILAANNTVDNYWIRAQSLEMEYNHTAEAILHYDGAPEDGDPTSTRKSCTEVERCLVLNCPFCVYPETEYTDCMFVDQLRSKEEFDIPPVTEEKFKEYFLNFAMPNMMGSVNGRSFAFPPVSALTQPTEIETRCALADCGEDKLCRCTNSLTLNKGETIQLVISNLGAGKGRVHPVHTHGHAFYVMKMGYGDYNESTGRFVAANRDIECDGNPDPTVSFCNNPGWAKSSWTNGNIPELVNQKPPRKDTLLVPSGGYVVVRIVADNPGLWILHCHIEMHTLDGMALVLNESFPDIPPAPPGFPQCGNFHWDGVTAATENLSSYTDNDTMTGETSSQQDTTFDGYKSGVFWGTVAGFLLVILFQLAIIGNMYFQPFQHMNRLRGYETVEN